MPPEDPRSPHRGCGCQHRGFVSKGSSFPSFPPPPSRGVFIGFWSGIRHVLTEQTSRCAQNPLLRRDVLALLVPGPALGWGQLGWGEPGWGLAQPFEGNMEPFRVTSLTRARALSLLPGRALITFCSNILPWERREGCHKERCLCPARLCQALGPPCPAPGVHHCSLLPRPGSRSCCPARCRCQEGSECPGAAPREPVLAMEK